MEKANKVFRRSGIRLSSVRSGHSSLKLTILGLKDSRRSYKSYIRNQETSWTDIVKWSGSEHNRSLREVIDNVMQLQAIWSDVQKQFLGALRKFQHQFEIILESEVHLDKSRAILTSCEQKEAKLLKELRRASNHTSVDELKTIEEKLEDLKSSMQKAQLEVATNTTENENIKMLLIKDGLINLSNQYVDLADKTSILFKAQRTIAATLPDAHSNVQDIRFNGSEECNAALDHVKRSLRSYRVGSPQITAPPQPPPYYPPSPPHETSLPTPYFNNLPRYYNVSQTFSNEPCTSGRNDWMNVAAAVPSNGYQYYHLRGASQLSSQSELASSHNLTVHYYDSPPVESYGSLTQDMSHLSVNH